MYRTPPPPSRLYSGVINGIVNAQENVTGIAFHHYRVTAYKMMETTGVGHLYAFLASLCCILLCLKTLSDEAGVYAAGGAFNASGVDRSQ
jgi:hypothetical protein